METGDKVKRRRFMLRCILGAVWIGLGALIFIQNRGHTLLVDNHNVEADNLHGEYRAPDLIKVSVNGAKALEFFRGDRDIFSVKGSRQRIRVEFSEGKAPAERSFTLPLMTDTFLLSIPKMINDIEPFVELFVSVPEARTAETEGNLFGDELPQVLP